MLFFFFSSRRRHTRFKCDWSSDVCSSDLINEFLGSLGLSIGADANAATGFDETQYTLRVPTDVPGVLDRALTILADWAGGATFDANGIERQRRIVLAEWRMNLGADERTADKVRRVQLEGSRFA